MTNKEHCGEPCCCAGDPRRNGAMITIVGGSEYRCSKCDAVARGIDWTVAMEGDFDPLEAALQALSNREVTHNPNCAPKGWKRVGASTSFRCATCSESKS